MVYITGCRSWKVHRDLALMLLLCITRKGTDWHCCFCEESTIFKSRKSTHLLILFQVYLVTNSYLFLLFFPLLSLFSPVISTFPLCWKWEWQEQHILLSAATLNPAPPPLLSLKLPASFPLPSCPGAPLHSSYPIFLQCEFGLAKLALN